MDEQTVFTEPRRIADEAIRAVEPVRVLIAHPLDLTPHVLTAVHLHSPLSCRIVRDQWLAT